MMMIPNPRVPASPGLRVLSQKPRSTPGSGGFPAATEKMILPPSATLSWSRIRFMRVAL